MNRDHESESARLEILAAYVAVLDRLPDLVEVCAAVDGDADDLRCAVQEAFGLSAIAADAVLALQVRRFTPAERAKIHSELADVEQRHEGRSGA